jgi:hypothetical protein
VKGGADGVGSHLLQLASDDGGEQGIQQIRNPRLARIEALTSERDYS